MSVREEYDGMTFGDAPESAAEALAWLVDQGDRFGQFINGAFGVPGAGFDAVNPASGEVLATLSAATPDDLDSAVSAAGKAERKWARLGGAGRARHLDALARVIANNARLCAVMEVLDTGRPIGAVRDDDLAQVQRQFQHHASLAQLIDDEWPGRAPLGVCAVILPSRMPLVVLARKLAPALAAGNSVIVKPSQWASLSALLFADLCSQAGLPKGVVNILTGDAALGERLACHAGIDMVGFAGSLSAGRALRRATAGSGKALSLEVDAAESFVVFDDADLDSAVEALAQRFDSPHRLLVQESVAERFQEKLRNRMEKLRVGDPLDRCTDIGAMANPAARGRLADLIARAGGDLFVPVRPSPGGQYHRPALITGLAPADPAMHLDIRGPVAVGMSFRTPQEALQLINNTGHAGAVSLWSETLSLVLDLAPRLAAGVVWINATGLTDAAAPHGGLREAGFGRDGGWDGLAHYTAANVKPKPLPRLEPFASANGAQTSEQVPEVSDATLFIAGRQVRPGGYCRNVHDKAGRILGQVALAGASDVGAAVGAAHNAADWSRRSGRDRARVLMAMSHALATRKEDLSHLINSLTGGRSGEKEIDTAIERLFAYAAKADTIAARAPGVPMHGLAVAERAPVGVIGAICPDEAPLLGLVSVLAPILTMGNRAVLLASEAYPLIAPELALIFECLQMPPGAVNLLTGCHADLASAMARHMEIEALWCFSSSDLSAMIERESAEAMKRTWVNDGHARDWFGAAGEDPAFLDKATMIRTTWLPAGI